MRRAPGRSVVANRLRFRFQKGGRQVKPRTRLVGLLLCIASLAILLSACAVVGKPSVVIMSPPSGSQYFEGEDIAVQSSASDSAGVVLSLIHI